MSITKFFKYDINHFIVFINSKLTHSKFLFLPPI